jgi:hypothetical protein
VGQDKDIQDILARGYADSKFFGKMFYPEIFDGPRSDCALRDRVYQAIDDKHQAYTAICGARGIGKSTLAKLLIIRAICYREAPFVVYLSKNYREAQKNTENLKMMLLNNRYIRSTFGNLKATSFEDVDLTFSKESYMLSDPDSGQPISMVVPKGRGQPVRGMNLYMGNKIVRPTLLVMDDLEDDEELLNEENRAKDRDWFYSEVLPCIDTSRNPDPTTNRWPETETEPPWRFFYIDTLKHEDSLMQHLLDSSRWASDVLPRAKFGKDDAGNPTYVSNVPELFSDEQIASEVEQAKQAGAMDNYAREFMCLPQATETASWTQDMFKYYREQDLKLQSSPEYMRFIIVDPANTSKQHSAYTAILAAAVDMDVNGIYMRSLINERLTPAEILRQTLDLAVRTNSPVVGVEVTGLDEHIQHMFETERRQRGLEQLKFVWLKSRAAPKGDYGTGRDAAKRARASQLVPYYQKGLVWHEERLKGSAMEQQMLSFDRPKYWDALDCAGYVPQILHEGGYVSVFADVEGMPFVTPWDESKTDDAQVRNRVWELERGPF